MLKMVDGTGIIGIDMISPLGVPAPQPPNYDKVEMEGTGILVLPNSLNAQLERLELGGKTEQVQTTGKNLFDFSNLESGRINISTGALEEHNHTRRLADYIDITDITSYSIYLPGYNKANGAVYVVIYYYDKDKKYLSYRACGDKQEKYENIAPVENAVYIKATLEQNTIDNPQNIFKVQLEKGAKSTDYEPYTGGKPSPSQEYQQEVKNTGKLNADTQKYEVGVKVTGKNLFDYEKAKEKSNWTTSANGAGFVEFAVYVCAGSTVTVSNNTKINNPGLYYYGVALKSSEDFKYFICYPGYPNSKDTHTFTATEDYIYVRCNKTSLNDVIGVCGGLQIEIGASRTDFESYKEQTLTITSDRPLTKWDRLVEQGGQYGWLYGGDIKTFENDVFKLYADNEKAIQYQVPFEEISNSWSELVCYCNTFENAIGQTIYTQSGKTDFYMGHVHKSMVFSAKNKQGIFQSIEAFQEWIRNSGTYVWYKTDNKKFVPLSESEQNAIRALKTYYPTTVITADGGELDPDIKVTYRKEI